MGREDQLLTGRVPVSPLSTDAVCPTQGSGPADEVNGLQGGKQARPRGAAPVAALPQSRSSEPAQVATLPARGPELSAQEQMEGMLCRKQEMEALGKKAANRYHAGPVAQGHPSREEVGLGPVCVCVGA